jgi:hypothetical protein
VADGHPVNQVDQWIRGEAVPDAGDVGGEELGRSEPSHPFLHHHQRFEDIGVHQRGYVTDNKTVRAEQPVIYLTGQVHAYLV